MLPKMFIIDIREAVDTVFALLYQISDVHSYIDDLLTELSEVMIEWDKVDASVDEYIVHQVYQFQLLEYEDDAKTLETAIWAVTNAIREQVDYHRLLRGNIFPYSFHKLDGPMAIFILND